MSACKGFWATVVAAWLAVGGSIAAMEMEADLADALQTLQTARVPAHGQALLDFFRKRTLSEADQAKLAGVVRQLGDQSFRIRQQAEKNLVAAGRPARSFLRLALSDHDLEIVRRAERLLRRLEDGS